MVCYRQSDKHDYDGENIPLVFLLGGALAADCFMDCKMSLVCKLRCLRCSTDSEQIELDSQISYMTDKGTAIRVLYSSKALTELLSVHG